jgi:hypothetical protein
MINRCTVTVSEYQPVKQSRIRGATKTSSKSNGRANGISLAAEPPPSTLLRRPWVAPSGKLQLAQRSLLPALLSLKGKACEFYPFENGRMGRRANCSPNGVQKKRVARRAGRQTEKEKRESRIRVNSERWPACSHARAGCCEHSTLVPENDISLSHWSKNWLQALSCSWPAGTAKVRASAGHQWAEGHR